MTTTNFNKEQLINVPIASETVQGLVERATDLEATTGSDTTRYITPKQAKDNYLTKEQTRLAIPSNILKYSADTERGIGEVSYTKKKEIQINIKGTVRVSVDFTGTYWQPGSSKGRVYVNGVAVGTERTDNGFPGPGYQTYTDDIAVNIGDLVQYYLTASGTGRGANCKNFRILYDKTYIADGIVILN